jgi:hypothetical protein
VLVVNVRGDLSEMREELDRQRLSQYGGVKPTAGAPR